jgi:glyoxalase-like protein
VRHHHVAVLNVDHVVIAVANLDTAGRALAERNGLASYAGGRHPEAGTANRIVPLQGGAYLELLAVVDSEARGLSPLAGLVRRTLDASRNLAAWAVATDDIDTEAKRLGLEVTAMSRVREDGTALTWRLAGVSQSAAEPCLPFFIQWDRPDLHPAREELRHDLGAVGLQEVEVAADPERLFAWLGPNAPSLPLRLVAPRRSAGPGVWSLTLTTERAGMVRLGREGLFPLTGRMPRGIVRRG